MTDKLMIEWDSVNAFINRLRKRRDAITQALDKNPFLWGTFVKNWTSICFDIADMMNRIDRIHDEWTKQKEAET